jgi:hypothetical protein
MLWSCLGSFHPFPETQMSLALCCPPVLSASESQMNQDPGFPLPRRGQTSILPNHWPSIQHIYWTFWLVALTLLNSWIFPCTRTPLGSLRPSSVCSNVRLSSLSKPALISVFPRFSRFQLDFPGTISIGSLRASACFWPLITDLWLPLVDIGLDLPLQSAQSELADSLHF